MSISNKLITVAENVPKVYESGNTEGNAAGYTNGYEAGRTDGYYIGYDEGYGKGKAEGVEEGKHIGYNSGYTEGFEEGKTTEQNAFWDTYQDNGNRRDYNRAFAGSFWTDETYDPKYPIVAEDFTEMFMDNDKITSTKVTIDLTNAKINSNINKRCFANCSSLKTIPKLIVGEQTWLQYAFDYCTSLEHIGIEGALHITIDLQTCENLDKETIMQIAFIANDFIENPTRPTFAETVILTDSGYEIVDNELVDERFPEKYQGMTIVEVLTEKGWTC